MRVVVVFLLGLSMALAGPVTDMENYGDWSKWSECSASCGGGYMSRTIACVIPGWGQVLDPCRQTKASCNSFTCPDDPFYIDWKNWEECDVACGGGTRSRKGASRRAGEQRQTINCHVQSCEELDPYEECGVANLVFVLDSSQSVGELNWYVIKQFVIDILSKLTIGEEFTHVGVVIYATDVQVVIDLDNEYDAEKLMSKIWKLPYLAGATNTGEGIKAMREIMERGRRDGVKDITIVLSDGKTNIVEETVQKEASLAKENDITIFSIGVSSEIDEKEMEGIASEPSEQYFTYVSNFDDLQRIIDDIVNGACKVTNVLECGDWSDWRECSVSCGSGEQTRTKQCRLVDSTGAVLEEDIIREEAQECTLDACPIELPEPSNPEPAEPSEPVKPSEPEPAEPAEPEPAEPSEPEPAEPAKPEPAEPSEPSEPEPAEPAKPEPEEPAEPEPADPEPAEPSEPEPAEPSEPEPAEPAEPEPAEPAEPEPAEPSEPEPAEPSEPEPAEPAEPEPAEPSEPEPAEPAEPEPAEPAEPEPAEPSEPEPAKPAKPEPAEPEPAEPTEPEPAEPAEPEPAEPDEPEPTEPSEPEPAEPEEPEPAEPAEPAEPEPAEPSEPGPVEPAEPEPAEPSEPVPPVDCGKCDYGPYGTVQYLPDPENCNCFYQCERLATVGASGEYTYIAHHQCCAASLYWRQSWLTCVTEPNKETGECIELALTVIVDDEDFGTSVEEEYICPLEAVAETPRSFLNGGIVQNCPQGTAFDINECACVFSDIEPETEEELCDPEVLLYFPYDEDLNDHGCQRASATQTSEQSVVLVDDVERGTVAYFAGASSLHVGFIYNYFADNPRSQWSVAVWTKRTGDSSSLAGIINNGDCEGAPSFEIHAGSGDVSGCSLVTGEVEVMAASDDVKTLQDDWEHLAMVYDGASLTLYLNGEVASTAPATGDLTNRQCAMNIGALHAGTDYFQGYMDEVYIYEKAITPEEVRSLSKV